VNGGIRKKISFILHLHGLASGRWVLQKGKEWEGGKRSSWVDRTLTIIAYYGSLFMVKWNGIACERIETGGICGWCD